MAFFSISKHYKHYQMFLKSAWENKYVLLNEEHSKHISFTSIYNQCYSELSTFYNIK